MSFDISFFIFKMPDICDRHFEFVKFLYETFVLCFDVGSHDIFDLIWSNMHMYMNTHILQMLQDIVLSNKDVFATIVATI